MQVYVLERVPKGLRGEFTRWMLEVKAGVFVGNVSALVRDKLWDRACRETKGGSALLLHTTNNEQGYTARLWGEPSYYPADCEGMWLVRRPVPSIPSESGRKS